MKKKKFLGFAFKDQMAKISVKSGHFKQNEKNQEWIESLVYGWSSYNELTPSFSIWRRYFLLIIVIVVFATFLFRLFHLQIIEGSTNRELSDFNRVQIKVIHAPRGVIYDRNGKILAQNEPGFRIDESSPGAKKIRTITRDEALKLEIEGNPLFNNLEIDHIRSYPLGEAGAHVLGYVAEITDEELKDPKYKLLRLGDKIGKEGVESIYESILRGKDGGEIVEIDAQGKKKRLLRESKPSPGQNLYLSIDKDLQLLTFKLIKEAAIKANSCCAAALVSDPQTGEILALVSYPSYNPSDLENALNREHFPFLNRSIAGVYPPGSVFKIVSSFAGLISGKIDKNTSFEDTGVIYLGEFEFSNWFFNQYGRKEGSVDLVKALKRSNDIFYYRLSQLTGEKLIGETAKSLGLGKKLGIDLPGEEVGVIPGSEWKLNYMDQVWFPGDTLHMSIGQGFVLTTPLQLNVMMGIVAADGKQYPPHIALKITDSQGREIKKFQYNPSLVTQINGENLALVKKGLEEVPKIGGTAWPFFTFPIATAGKTGTAEFGDPKNKTHAWYTAYAPTDTPKVAVTILIEGGGEGSSVASPVAKEILRWFLSPDKTNLVKDITPIVATESAKSLGE
ncbi:hypothetical protein HYS91_02435 [Candidatus Daviesbacteria bacterium]|nr:hypothetical protein [Candidatus Daviesbacteria bacterium]